MNLRSFCLGVGVVAALVSPGHAMVVYDSIIGGTYSNGGWTDGSVNFQTFTNSYTAAVQFTPSVTGYIDGLTLSLFGGSSGTVQIFSDNGGTLGSSLESLSLSESPNYGTFASGQYTSGVTLNQGTAYWVVATDAIPAQYWYYINFASPKPVKDFLGQGSGNQPLVTTGTYYSNANSPDGLGLKVDVATAVTPLPGTLPLFGTVLGALGLLGWLRKRTGYELAV